MGCSVHAAAAAQTRIGFNPTYIFCICVPCRYSQDGLRPGLAALKGADRCSGRVMAKLQQEGLVDAHFALVQRDDWGEFGKMAGRLWCGDMAVRVADRGCCCCCCCAAPLRCGCMLRCVPAGPSWRLSSAAIAAAAAACAGGDGEYNESEQKLSEWVGLDGHAAPELGTMQLDEESELCQVCRADGLPADVEQGRAVLFAREAAVARRLGACIWKRLPLRQAWWSGVA